MLNQGEIESALDELEAYFSSPYDHRTTADAFGELRIIEKQFQNEPPGGGLDKGVQPRRAVTGVEGECNEILKLTAKIRWLIPGRSEHGSERQEALQACKDVRKIWNEIDTQIRRNRGEIGVLLDQEKRDKAKEFIRNILTNGPIASRISQLELSEQSDGGLSLTCLHSQQGKDKTIAFDPVIVQAIAENRDIREKVYKKLLEELGPEITSNVRAMSQKGSTG